MVQNYTIFSFSVALYGVIHGYLYLFLNFKFLSIILKQINL